MTPNNVGKRSEVIARNEREHDRIWNAAIEKAAICAGSRPIASVVLNNKDHELALYVQSVYIYTAAEIRKLKK